jgi:hypothetical protein
LVTKALKILNTFKEILSLNTSTTLLILGAQKRNVSCPYCGLSDTEKKILQIYEKEEKQRRIFSALLKSCNLFRIVEDCDLSRINEAIIQQVLHNVYTPLLVTPCGGGLEYLHRSPCQS